MGICTEAWRHDERQRFATAAGHQIKVSEWLVVGCGGVKLVAVMVLELAWIEPFCETIGEAAPIGATYPTRSQLLVHQLAGTTIVRHVAAILVDQVQIKV